MKLVRVMARTTARGVRTQASILEIAFELFSRQGYHATTMRQIARRAGLTPGSIYNHFSGKDAIFEAVLKKYHPLNQISPVPSEAEGDRIEQRIRLLAKEVARVLDEHPALLNLSLVEMVELDGKHLPVVAESLRPQMMAFVQQVSAEPERLQVSPLTAFRVFLGLLFAYELTDRFVQTALQAEAAEMGSLDDFIDVYLSGILKSEEGNEERNHYA
jgi:AcrR family transcriptional regulator